MQRELKTRSNGTRSRISPRACPHDHRLDLVFCRSLASYIGERFAIVCIVVPVSRRGDRIHARIILEGIMTASGVAGNSPLPKWQLALVVGAPVALGLGYMYYKNKNNSNGSSDRASKSSERDKFRSGTTSSKENGAPADKQISIDGDCPPKVPSPVAESEVKRSWIMSHYRENSFN